MEVGLSRLTFEVTRLSELAGSTLPETPPPTIEQLTNAFTSDEMISIAGTLGLNYRGAWLRALDMKLAKTECRY